MAFNVNKVIELAVSQIGYKETGTNITKYAKFFDDAYPNFYNTKKQGAEWCDIFVDWCFVQAYGFNDALKLLCQPTKSCGAGVSWSYDYFKKKKQTGSTPKVGAQIFFRANKDATKPNHTGLVIAVEKTEKYYKITTIEGNKSDSVKKCTYTTDTKIFGFGYPDYSMKTEDEAPATPSAPAEKPKEEKPKTTTKKYKEYVVVCKSGLNVRTGMGTNYKTIKPAYNYGATVKVASITRSWAKLYDRTGYVCTGVDGVKYLKLKG